MTFQIGKARGTNPITEPSKPAAAPSSNVSPGNLSPWPNLATLPTVGPPSAWQKGVVSTAAKEERAAAEQNGTAITIGASEARVAAGEAINHAQTEVSSAGTIAQDSATTNTDSEFAGDIVGAAQKGNEESLKAEVNHDDQVAKQRSEALKEINDARLQGELPVGVAVA